jgi:hypothetical protein
LLEQGNLQEPEAERLQGFWFWIASRMQTIVSYLADTITSTRGARIGLKSRKRAAPHPPLALL